MNLDCFYLVQNVYILNFIMLIQFAYILQWRCKACHLLIFISPVSGLIPSFVHVLCKEVLLISILLAGCKTEVQSQQVDEN